jgi:hypothetical protein
MFDCAAARFLAVQEALNDSNKQIFGFLSTNERDSADDSDVILELTFAAEYLANGEAVSSNIDRRKSFTSSEQSYELKAIVFSDESLISMAVNCIMLISHILIQAFAYILDFFVLLISSQSRQYNPSQKFDQHCQICF